MVSALTTLANVLMPPMAVIPTVPALMRLEHILVAVMLFSEATDSLVPISTNVQRITVKPTLPAQTQAVLLPAHVMLPTTVMVSAVFTTTMSDSQARMSGTMPILTYALLTIPKYNSHVLVVTFQSKLTVTSSSIPMLTTLQLK